MTLDPQKKDGVRISCQKLEVKVDDSGNILAFIDGGKRIDNVGRNGNRTFEKRGR